MENQTEKKAQDSKTEKRSRKLALAEANEMEILDGSNVSVKLMFEGEAAKRILKCQAELKERHSKPDLAKIIGAEILSWNERKWAEIVEENTDVEFFFAQIKQSGDKARAIRLLRSLAEKLRNEPSEAVSPSSDGAHDAGVIETYSEQKYFA